MSLIIRPSCSPSIRNRLEGSEGSMFAVKLNSSRVLLCLSGLTDWPPGLSKPSSVLRCNLSVTVRFFSVSSSRVGFMPTLNRAQESIGGLGLIERYLPRSLLSLGRYGLVLYGCICLQADCSLQEISHCERRIE